MSPEQPGLARVERVLQVFSGFAEAEEADRRYWWSRTPQERLQGSPEPSGHPGSPHHQRWTRETWESEQEMRHAMTYTEGLRALTALHLYRSRTGNYPEKLSRLDGLVGHRPCNYLSNDGQFRYRRNGGGIQLSAPGTPDGQVWTP